MAYKRPRHLSLDGAKFIAGYEGWRSRPYNDSEGHATIGYGHLLHHGNVTAADRKRWGTITRTAGLHLLQADAEIAAAAVRKLVKPKLNQAQFDALVCFVFNVGTGAFASSSLLRKLNTHPGSDHGITGKVALRQVHDELLRWIDKGTSSEAGLRSRRIAEAHKFGYRA